MIQNLLNYSRAILGCLIMVCFTQLVYGQQLYNISGTATVLPNEDGVELTPEANTQVGWAYYSSKFNLSVKDSLVFKIFLGDNNGGGADGMVFIMHNDVRGFSARGCAGETMGYGTHPDGLSSAECGFGTRSAITPSLAIEFDTYPNSFDPTFDHIAYLENGNVNHGSNFIDVGGNLDNNVEHDFKLVWDPSLNNLKIYLDNTLMLDTTRDIINSVFGGTAQVFWGFAASTGGSVNQQYFRLIDDNVIVVTPTVTSIASGNWSTPSVWSTGVVPNPDDSIIISASHTVTIDQNVSARAISVLATGILQFEATTNRTVTLTSGMYILTGGTLRSNPTGVALHQLNLGGNLSNAGTLDCNTGISAGLNITFNNAFRNQFLNLTGATLTDWRRLTINKANNNFAVVLQSALSFTETNDTLVHTWGRIDLNGNSLTLGSYYEVANSSSFSGSSSSNLTLSGSSATFNNISFFAGAQVLNNFTVSRNAGLGTALTVNGVYTSSVGSLTQGTSLALNGNIVLSGGTITVGTNTLTIGSNSITRSAGGINPGTGTITFNNSSALVVPVSLFTAALNNLTIASSGGVTLSENLSVNATTTLTSGTLSVGANTLTAANWVNNGGQLSTTSGGVTFNGATRTIGGTASTNFGVLTVANNTTVTMNNSNSCASFVFATGANASTFTHGTGAVLTVNGAVTIPNPSASVVKNWAINAGSATISGNVNIGNNSSTLNQVARITVTTGSITILGNLVFSSSNNPNANLNINTAGATVNLAGVFSNITQGSITASATSNFNFNGTVNQIIPMANTNITFGNLIINNTNVNGATVNGNISTARLLGNISVNSGLFRTGGVSVTMSNGRSITVESGATFNAGRSVISFGTGTKSFTINGTLISSNLVGFSGSATATINSTNAPTFALTNGTFIFDSSGAQVVTSRTDYGNVILSNGSKTISAGSFTVGNLTINTGATYNGGTNNPTLTVNGNFTNNGTFTSGTNVTTFAGNAPQTIGGTTATTFSGNVSFSGTGQATLSNNISVAANRTLTVNANKTLDLGLFTANAANTTNTLVLSGTLKLGAATGGQTGSNFPTGYNTITINAGSTVEYNGANTITQTVYSSGTTAYSNLILTNGTGSGTAFKRSTASFSVGSTFEVKSGVQFTPAALNVISGAGSLIGNGAIDVTNSPNNVATQYTLTRTGFSGTIGTGFSGAIAGGTYSNLTLTGTGVQALSGNIIVTGSLTIGSGTQIDPTTSDFSITLSGNWVNNGNGISTQAGSSVIFNGTNQTISGNTTSFNSLTISSGTTTLAVNTTILENLTVSAGATLSLGTFTCNRSTSGGTLTVAGLLQVAGANNFPANFTTRTMTGGTVEFNGLNSVTQQIGTGFTYNNLLLTNGSGTGNAAKTSAGNFTVNGNLTISENCTFTPAAANVVSGTGTLTGNGTIAITRTAATPDLNSQYNLTNRVLTGLTANYSAAAAQTINAHTYGNLLLSGSNTKTISGGAVSVNGTLTINTGITLATGGNNINIGVNWVNDGTFSGTGTVTFNGSSNQSISGTSTTPFNNLTISNSGSDSVFVASNITVSGNLTVNANSTLVPSATATVGGTGTLLGSGAILVSSTAATPLTTQYTITNRTLTSLSVNYESTTASTITAASYGSLLITGSRGGNSVTLASGTIGIANTFSPAVEFTSGSYITTGNTIDFNGSSSQTIPSFNYQNLTISGSRGGNTVTLAADTIGVVGVLSFTATNLSYGITGSTIEFRGSGAQTIPAFNYFNLLISQARGGANITLATGTIGVAGAASLTATGIGSIVNAGNTMDFNGSSSFEIPPLSLNNLVVSGNKNGGVVTLAPGTISVAGSFINTATNVGSYVTTNNTFQYSGSGTQTIAAFGYNNLSSTNADRILSATADIQIAGTFTPGTGNYTTTNSTVVFNGSASQTIPPLNYFNLTSTSTGSRTFGTADTIQIAGTFTPGTNSYTTVNSTVEFQGTSAQSIPAFNYHNLVVSNNRGTNNITLASGTIGVGGTFTNNASFTSGGFVSTNNTINYNGSGPQSVAAFNYNNLTISGPRTAGDITFPAAVVGIAGVFNPSAAFSSGTYITSSGTINYNGSSNQSITGFTYNNLSLNGGSTKLAVGLLTINGLLDIGSGVLSLGTSNLILNGTYSSSGSISGTSSSRLIINGTGALSAFSFQSGGQALKTLILNRTSGNFILGSNIAIADSLTLTNGNVIIGSQTLTINGVITRTNGLLQAGSTSNLSIGGSGTLNNLLFVTGTDSFNNVTINRLSSGLVSLASSWKIGGVLTLTQGSLAIGNNTLILNGTSTRTNGFLAGSANSNLTIGGTTGGEFGFIAFATGDETLQNLTINRSGVNANVTLASNLTVNNVLERTNGSFTLGINTLTLNGTVTGPNGFVGSNSSSIVIGGSGNFGTLRLVTNTNLLNLTINRSSSGSVTLGSNLGIASTGGITLSNGVLVLNGNTLTINGNHSRTSGTITGSNTSTIVLRRGLPFSSALAFTAGAQELGVLTVNGAGGSFPLGSDLTVLTTLNMNQGVLSINNQTLTIEGQISGTNATFSGSLNSSLVINGTGPLTASSIGFTTGARELNTFTFNRAGASLNLSSDLAISNIGNFEEGTLNLNGNTLTLQGTVNRTNGLINASGVNSTIAMNGSVSQIIADDIFVDTLVRNLTINNASGVSMVGKIKLTGILTPTAGTLTTNDNLVLISNASGTGRIAAGSGSYITGDVTAQRFVDSTGRRWRFMASPVTGTTVQDWQDETHITGPGGAVNGFDPSSNNTPSIFSYNESLPGDLNQGFVAPTNINQGLGVGVGYRIFIRGDRTPSRLTGSLSTQGAVTLDLVGPVNIGDISMPVTYTSHNGVANDGWNLLGNPYPCDYDWNAYHDAGRNDVIDSTTGTNYTKISPVIYVLNAISNGYDSYNAKSNIGIGALSGGIIPHGAAFWVKATALSPSMTFVEPYKTNLSAGNIYKAENTAFRIKLIRDGINTDELAVKYMTGSMVNFDGYDIQKLSGAVNISAYGADSILLAATVRPIPLGNDTIRLRIAVGSSASMNGTYTLDFRNTESISLLDQLWLVDNYLGTITDLQLNPTYTFTITTSISATQGSGRFYLVVGNNSQLPVTLIQFRARSIDGQKVGLTWSTAQEINNKGFTVERSIDGKTFNPIGFVDGKGNANRLSNYSFDDLVPEANNFYRLAQIDFSGDTYYSQVIQVKLNNKTTDQVLISPNPVRSGGTISLQSGDRQLKGYRILDYNGQFLQEGFIQNQSNELLIQNWPTGVYFLQLLLEDDTLIEEKLVIAD
ncbi:MAG: hypothetical protein MUE96_11135 [Bacteroidia bacterium]|nr:hypothetical protein [Bacteroidia bacterium]